MSHSVEIKTKFVNKEALVAALQFLGWSVEYNTTRRTYPTDPASGKVHSLVAVNPNSNGYDVGFDEVDGEYVAYVDWFDRSIAASLGEDLCKLKQQYTVKVAEQLFEEIYISERFNDGSFIMEINDGY